MGSTNQQQPQNEHPSKTLHNSGDTLQRACEFDLATRDDLIEYVKKAFGNTTYSEEVRGINNTVALFAISNKPNRNADFAECAAAEQ